MDIFNKKRTNQNYFNLIFASAIASLISVFLIVITKHLTEYCQHKIYNFAFNNYKWLFIIAPSIGITAIYFLRKYLFKGKKNKGITEIYNSLDLRKEHLPFFKIPSHLINGFLTITFGGSTGIEVSSVVASATVGNMVNKQKFSLNKYKNELICAGVTAGVAILFSNPLAGMFFALEVISRKYNKTVIISCFTSGILSAIYIYRFENQTLLPYFITNWNWNALPFFVLLSLICALVSVYFTFIVTRLKTFFGNINNNFIRVNLGALSVGICIFFFPLLYGDSYHGVIELLHSPTSISLLLLALLVILKPLVAALTLGAGGDGGVFAPSIVAGALLGFLFAQTVNFYFDMHLIPINFVLVGIAATLSASIFAPITALLLATYIVPNGYLLFFPLLLGSFSAKYFAQKILPYNVYTYDSYKTQKANQKLTVSDIA